ncbi:MAG: NUDIX hydrolase [Promethearchaeota archaeon]
MKSEIYENKPLAVVVGLIIRNGYILLVERIRGEYIGFYALPGGKIKKNEHLHEAIEREILEETNLECRFNKLLGVVSELVFEDNFVKNHFLLHICSIDVVELPKSSKFKHEIFPQSSNNNKLVYLGNQNKNEGGLIWIPLKKLNEHKNKIIESDYEIINYFFKNKEKIYNNQIYISCEMEKIGNKYTLKQFQHDFD